MAGPAFLSSNTEFLFEFGLNIESAPAEMKHSKTSSAGGLYALREFTSAVNVSVQSLIVSILFLHEREICPK